MNLHISDNTDSSDENSLIENLDDGLSDTEASQTETREKQFNISARRRIEEYMESKRLTSQTADYYFTD